MASRDYSFKFLLVGNSSVGKTSIVRRLCLNDYMEDQPSTIGVEFMTHTLTIDGHNIKLQIWDTAGQERYQSVGKAYYRNAIGVLIVFSLTDHGSFQALENWVDQVRKYCHPKVKMIIVGNKKDLVDKKAVTDSEIQQFMDSHNMTYMESSAKINKNIREAFFSITQEIYHSVVSGDIVLDAAPSEKLTNKAQQDDQGCKC
ncbi:Ras family protein [Tritrichomonas foetus]|uniref:Ras family protein n=1 Tax=Tritrichomonas foetus TaxID=1144522 RepID=A0A1J4JSU3_9EUKA|nr:Ras family protein [Tritrichomonas foetus]|eukprot:OHT00572.1 Ras family protein [Tritrichomonas foetus]